MRDKDHKRKASGLTSPLLATLDWFFTSIDLSNRVYFYWFMIFYYNMKNHSMLLF